MAALLRQGAAARRLGGSMVHRTQAEGRRRLVHTTQQLGREEVLREIQQKKDELYDLIAKAEKNFWTSSFQNLWLQQYLSVQVSPRPWDWRWRHLRFSRRVNRVLEVAGFIALGGVAGYVKRQYAACCAAREKLWAGVLKEEEVEARASFV